jgi:predicted nucleic acid-binding protein
VEIQQPKVVARLVQDFRLGAGEAEALALALEKGELAIVATDTGMPSGLQGWAVQGGDH